MVSTDYRLRNISMHFLNLFSTEATSTCVKGPPLHISNDTYEPFDTGGKDISTMMC